MDKMAAATSQAGSGAGRRRGPPGQRSGRPRRPARGTAERGERTGRGVNPGPGHEGSRLLLAPADQPKPSRLTETPRGRENRRGAEGSGNRGPRSERGERVSKGLLGTVVPGSRPAPAPPGAAQKRLVGNVVVREGVRPPGSRRAGSAERESRGDVERRGRRGGEKRCPRSKLQVPACPAPGAVRGRLEACRGASGGAL